MERTNQEMVQKKEKRKGIDKRKVMKYAGAAVILVALGSGVSLYDTTIDHVNEKCLLTTIFGLRHQADIINQQNDQGYFAYYQPSEIASRRAIDIVDAKKVVNEDGTVSHELPEGYENYTLVGDKAVLYAETVEIDEQVIVTKTESVVCADGTCDLVTTEVNRFFNGSEVEPAEDLDTTEPTGPSR